MPFHSMAYGFFFACVVAVHFLLPHRLRGLFLVAASYAFYMAWDPRYALLLLTSTGMGYSAGLLLARSAGPRRRRAILLAGLVVNLGMLLAFKYANLARDALAPLSSALWPSLEPRAVDIALPVGLSFYTFQTLGYLFDVYRRRIEPERNMARFALFVSFFPQLLAGPIGRARELLPQIREPRGFDALRALEGIQLIAWGLFQKVVVADRLALYVDWVYAAPRLHSVSARWLAMYFFAVQLYCDFAGYTDIARGSARVLGFDLAQNFRLPFFSTTTAEFWQRWHMTLMNWFRDYLYLPLVLQYRSQLSVYACAMLVMLVSGVWHGAGTTFLVWGLSQGILVCLSRFTLAFRDGIYARLRVPTPLVRAIRIMITFHLFAITLVFFRARSLADAAYILNQTFDPGQQVHFSGVPMVQCLAANLVLLLVQLLQARRPLQPLLNQAPRALRWAVYYAVVFAIVLFGVDSGVQFIYLQF